MPLIYKPRLSNLKNKDGKLTWHPSLVKVGNIVNAIDLAKEVSEKSALTPGDTLSCINGLIEVMKRYLLNSRTVRLDGLGTFTVIARSRGNGVEKEKDVKPSQITSLRVRFTPTYTYDPVNGTTRSIFLGVQFVKEGDEKRTSDDDNNGGDNGGGGGIIIDPNA